MTSLQPRFFFLFFFFAARKNSAAQWESGVLLSVARSQICSCENYVFRALVLQIDFLHRLHFPGLTTARPDLQLRHTTP